MVLKIAKCGDEASNIPEFFREQAAGASL